MTWLVDNWVILVGFFCVLGLTVARVYDFVKIPTKEQIAKVKEWLLYAVTLAEREFETGTGQLKLRYVYDMFVDKFSFAEIFTFEKFSKLVDEALGEMKKMLESNKKMAEFVEGSAKDE